MDTKFAKKAGAIIGEKVSAMITDLIQELLDQELGHLVSSSKKTLSIPSISVKKQGRRPDKAVDNAIFVGQIWEGKTVLIKGRIIEILSLGTDRVTIKAEGSRPDRKIKYETLKNCYKLIVN